MDIKQRLDESPFATNDSDFSYKNGAACSIPCPDPSRKIDSNPKKNGSCAFEPALANMSLPVKGEADASNNAPGKSVLDLNTQNQNLVAELIRQNKALQREARELREEADALRLANLELSGSGAQFLTSNAQLGQEHSEIVESACHDEFDNAVQGEWTILNALPASIALLDRVGNIIKVNDQWMQFGEANGLSNKYTHLGTNYIAACENARGRDEFQAREMARGLRRILSGEDDYFTMEYPCDSPSQKRWFKAEVKPFKSKGVRGALVMHIDISERKRFENQMLLLINNTDEAFILLDRNLQIKSFNNQSKNLFKKFLGGVICHDSFILDYAAADIREELVSFYKQVLEGNTHESEIEFPEESGPRFYTVKYRPAKDEHGNIFGVFITAADVTSNKIALEQREFERRNKEALINSTDDLIWSVSKDFKLIAANDAFLREVKEFTGFEVRQGDNLLMMDFHSEQYIRDWKALYTRANNGESFKIEIYTPQVAARAESWTETTFSPIIVNGTIAGAACYARNITQMKFANEQLIVTSNALQHAVNSLNKVMDSSLDVICAVSADGNFLKVSAASEAVWGYKPEELIGKPLIDFVYHEDREKTLKRAEHVMAGNNQYYFENRYVRKDGSLVPIEWVARWDAKDQIRYGVARDITEKKRLRDAIENERQRFSDLFKEAPSSMGVLSGPDHVFEIVNPLFLNLIKKENIIGKTVKEVLPEAVHQGFIDVLDEVYRTGKTFSANEMLFRLNVEDSNMTVDKYLNFMYRAHKAETGEIVGILFFAVDVTEQVILRQKIEVSEAKLKEAQALLHISNWEIDLTNDVHTWSDEFYRTLKLNKDEVEPSSQLFLSLIHPDDVDFVRDRMEAASQSYTADAITARIRLADGTIKYIYSEWKFEFDNQSTPVRIFGIMQDISERKIAEEEREKLIHDLMQRKRDLEQFTFIVSHNLRAPTANIIGFTQLLQDDSITVEEQKELLNGLSSSVSGLDAVIRDINSILQINREVNEKKELISLPGLVSEVMTSIDNITSKQKVKVYTDFSAIEDIFSLRVYLHSIFYNLISNSIKYRKPEGEACIDIKGAVENGKIILSFADNGLGIDLNTKGDQVFGLYKRFHSHVEGKGMGLFLVKTQVESMGGKISIASQLGVGTEFTIVFDI